VTHEPHSTDETLVAQARLGSLQAWDSLVKAHQPWVFNLALRMTWRRVVAEDATQEIFIKVVRRIHTFAGHSSFRTWLHRIAVNHLLDVRKSEMEERAMTFTDLASSLDSVEAEDLPAQMMADPGVPPPDRALLLEEAKYGCMTAMLMCLDRRQRLAFILGEVLGETGENAAAAMEISHALFRQLLARARYDLYQFMAEKCGLVNSANPCRCARKAAGFMRRGWLDPAQRQFTRDRVETVRVGTPEGLEELSRLDQEHARLHRQQPLLTGPDLTKALRHLITTSRVGGE
jgi:RNA polymerase sigma factor (sigma-70 family)